jgi:hypothetical protein
MPPTQSEKEAALHELTPRRGGIGIKLAVKIEVTPNDRAVLDDQAALVGQAILDDQAQDNMQQLARDLEHLDIAYKHAIVDKDKEI